MTPARDPLLDFMRALATGRQHPCTWHGQGALPLLVRINDKLTEILIAASEVQADVTSDAAGSLGDIAPEIEQVMARVDALIQQLAA